MRRIRIHVIVYFSSVYANKATITCAFSFYFILKRIYGTLSAAFYVSSFVDARAKKSFTTHLYFFFYKPGCQYLTKIQTYIHAYIQAWREKLSNLNLPMVPAYLYESVLQHQTHLCICIIMHACIIFLSFTASSSTACCLRLFYMNVQLITNNMSASALIHYTCIYCVTWSVD